LQKPSRVYVEKSLEEIFHNMGKPLPTVIYEEGHPGDRDDNLWVTINDYKPPKTQIEWEQTCFLDKPFYGYYTWPKMIKYSMNKRARYTQNNMPEEAAILYDRFTDKNFVARVTQLMILEEEKDDKNFNKIQFAMFKVNRRKNDNNVVSPTSLETCSLCENQLQSSFFVFKIEYITYCLGSLSQFWSRIYRQLYRTIVCTCS
jgi:hypothetical protein